MHHTDWNGLIIMDTVFPFFLLLAGLSFPFFYASQLEKDRSSQEIQRKIFVRCLILIALGLVYYGFFNFQFPQRYASVLGRIGLAWMFAALLYIHCKTRTRIIIAGVTLLVYGQLITLIKAPDAAAGPLTQEDCLNG